MGHLEKEVWLQPLVVLKLTAPVNWWAWTIPRIYLTCWWRRCEVAESVFPNQYPDRQIYYNHTQHPIHFIYIYRLIYTSFSCFLSTCHKLLDHPICCKNNIQHLNTYDQIVDGYKYGWVWMNVCKYLCFVEFNLVLLTWVGGNFWAGSSRRQHKPTENFHECTNFAGCVEGDE